LTKQRRRFIAGRIRALVKHFCTNFLNIDLTNSCDGKFYAAVSYVKERGKKSIFHSGNEEIGGGGGGLAGGSVLAGNLPAKLAITKKRVKSKVIDNEPFFTFYFIT
jgi:hypothetical protein